jgi:hypothetical protein
LLQLASRSFSVVVDDCDVELVPLAQLLVRDRKPDLDLPGRIGRSLAQPPLEVLERRGTDKD